MKAERLQQGEMVNPFFSHEDRRNAIACGKEYDTPAFLQLPKGQIVEDRDCWKLCLGESPVMKPADDECRAKVLQVMGSEKRLAFLRRLKAMSHPDVRRQMSKSQVEWLDSMLETYGDDIDVLDMKRPEPKPAPVAPEPISED